LNRSSAVGAVPLKWRIAVPATGLAYVILSTASIALKYLLHFHSLNSPNAFYRINITYTMNLYGVYYGVERLFRTLKEAIIG
jgi:hypothetical protein